MTIQPDGLYAVMIDIASAQIQLGRGSHIARHAKFASKRQGKWSIATNLPKWVIESGYEKMPVGGGMCYIIKEISIPPRLSLIDAFSHGLKGVSKLILECYSISHEP